MKKHNYVYTIVRQTPDENGVRKGYIGVHCTDNLEDGYFGSGVYLTRAVKKYGREDFVKTIVADFESEEEAVEYETELLHRMHRLSGGWELFRKRFYNLKLNEPRGKVSISDESRKKMSESRTGEKNGFYGKTHSLDAKKKIGEASASRTHSDEVKQKIGKAVAGENNPRFKGLTVGTSLEHGGTIIFTGAKSMEASGFSSSHINSVILRKRPHHKNFTFTRTKDPEILQSLLDQNNFIDEESKIIIEDFLRNS